MQLLACSDIHNNIQAVQTLRAQEQNCFDAILIAGDIGSESAANILDIFDSYQCPVFFVYGNWDNQLEYFSLDKPQRHQVHLNLFEVNRFYITGFSGCPTSWGKNPEAQQLLSQNDIQFSALLNNVGRVKAGISPDQKNAYHLARKAIEKQILQLTRKKLSEILAEIPDKNKSTLILTHERLTKLDEIGRPFMHIHGHLHTDSYSVYKGPHIFNVACLDSGIPPFQAARQPIVPKTCGYSIITIGNDRTVMLERKTL